MKQFALVVAALLAATGAAEAAKLYKYVDKDGRVTYQATPPAGYLAEEKELVGDKLAAPADTAKVPVVLYVAPKCASCDMAQAYLDKRRVPYTLKNAESDPVVQGELKTRSGGMSVPTIIVGEKVMRGYMESLLEGELDAAGFPKMGDATAPKAGSEDTNGEKNE
jgi:glutaredoxin